MYWYNCSKCGTVIKQGSFPNSTGCPAKGSHSWSQIAEVGDKNYQCRTCGVTVQTRHSPSGSCRDGGSHRWTKL